MASQVFSQGSLLTKGRASFSASTRRPPSGVGSAGIGHDGPGETSRRSISVYGVSERSRSKPEIIVRRHRPSFPYSGSRLARMVIATSNGPCLRASQGNVPVSAKLALARLPASRAACAKIIEPNVAGGRNTTWPSRRCGASRPAMSGCAKAGAGHRISSARFTASAMSVVTSASLTS